MLGFKTKKGNIIITSNQKNSKSLRTFSPKLSEVYYNIEDLNNSSMPIKYVVSKNGKVYEVVDNEIARFILYTGRVLNADKIEEKITYKNNNIISIMKNIKYLINELGKSEKILENTKKEELSEMIGYYTSLETALNSDKLLNYCISSEGLVYEIINNESFTMIKKTDTVIGCEEIKEGFEYKLPKKIPYKIFLQVLSFFRDICDKMNNAEAHVQIYWDREKQEYFVYVPEQEVTTVSVDYKGEWQEVKNKHLLVMEIHSHNTMQANPSSIDKNNDQENIFYMIIGKVKDFVPDLTIRYVVAGKYKFIDFNEIFENPFTNVEYPAEWHNRVRIKKVRLGMQQQNTLFDLINKNNKLNSTNYNKGNLNLLNYEDYDYINDYEEDIYSMETIECVEKVYDELMKLNPTEIEIFERNYFEWGLDDIDYYEDIAMPNIDFERIKNLIITIQDMTFAEKEKLDRLLKVNCKDGRFDFLIGV